MRIKTLSFGLILSYPVFALLHPYWVDIVLAQYEGIFYIEPGLAELFGVPLGPTLVFVAVCIGIGCLLADSLGVIGRIAFNGIVFWLRGLILWVLRRSLFSPGIPEHEEGYEPAPVATDNKRTVTAPADIDARCEFIRHRIQDVVARAVLEQATGLHITIGPDAAVLEHIAYGTRRAVDNMPPEVAREIVGHLFGLDACAQGSLRIEDVKAPMEFSTVYALGNRNVHVHGLLVCVHPEGSLHAKLDLKYAALSGIPPIEDLGYSDRQLAVLRQSLTGPSGLTLIAGPSGCGASTTLASMVHELPRNEPTYTIENPIAYDIPGVSQVDVSDLFPDRTLCELSRTIFNGSPRNIMLFEIDSTDAAQMAVRSVQAGARVFSYMQSDSALGALNRLNVLTDLKMLTSVVYQRLVPVLCPHCSVPVMGNLSVIDSRRPGLSMRVLAAFGGDLDGIRYRGLGCPFCKGNGAVQRTVVAETIRLDDKVRTLIHAGRIGDLEDYLRAGGWEPLRVHVLQKIKMGQVCPADAEGFALGTLLDEYVVPARAQAS